MTLRTLVVMSDSDGLPGLSRDGFSVSLGRFLAETRVDHAAESRVKERWLNSQFAEESGFVGTLTNLAEAQATVTLALRSAHVIRCTILMVGADFVLVGDESGTEHLIALMAINRLETSSNRSASSERRLPSPVGLTEALAVLSEERPEVAVHHLDGSGTRGELLAVSNDEARLRVRNPAFRTIIVRLASLSHVSTTSW